MYSYSRGEFECERITTQQCVDTLLERGNIDPKVRGDKDTVKTGMKCVGYLGHNGTISKTDRLTILAR